MVAVQSASIVLKFYKVARPSAYQIAAAYCIVKTFEAKIEDPWRFSYIYSYIWGIFLFAFTSTLYWPMFFLLGTDSFCCLQRFYLLLERVKIFSKKAK